MMDKRSLLQLWDDIRGNKLDLKNVFVIDKHLPDNDLRVRLQSEKGVSRGPQTNTISRKDDETTRGEGTIRFEA